MFLVLWLGKVSAMANRRLWFPPLLFLPLCLLGCDPDDMPAYTPDGKTVIALAHDAKGENVLWTCDVATGAAHAHRVPDGGTLFEARRFGDQIWLVCDRPVQPGGKETVREIKRFDLNRKEFLAVPPELSGVQLVKMVPGVLEGKKCLFVGKPNEEQHVYSFAELNELKDPKRPDSLNDPKPAGGFWTLGMQWPTKPNPDPNTPSGIERYDLFNPDGKRVCSITRQETLKVGDRARFYNGVPGCARVSQKGDVLMLALGNQGNYDFGVFDTANGALLWKGQAGACCPGTPLVRRMEVWTFDAARKPLPATGPASATTAPKGEYQDALIRYTPGPDGKPGLREEILQLPSDLSGPFAPSPDGSHFVMVVNGNPSRLLFIPIRQGVTAKDVRVVELKEK